MNLKQFVASEFSSAGHLMLHMAADSSDQIAKAGQVLLDCLMTGSKLLVFGNGGSAADAEHFVTELVGRYRQERDPLPAVALTANTPQLTALANDLGYEQIFARQVRAFAKPGDVVIGISTSGRSVNVITGLQEARDRGAHTIALIGADIIGLAAVAETVISVPATDTPRVQEAHSVIIHILCDIIERALLSQQTKKVRGDENISR